MSPLFHVRFYLYCYVKGVFTLSYTIGYCLCIWTLFQVISCSLFILFITHSLASLAYYVLYKHRLNFPKLFASSWFSCQIALVDTSSTMLNNSEDGQHPDLSVSISISSKMPSFEEVCIKVYHVKYSSIPSLLSVCIRNRCWTFLKSFLSIYENNFMIFLPSFNRGHYRFSI